MSANDTLKQLVLALCGDTLRKPALMERLKAQGKVCYLLLTIIIIGLGGVGGDDE